MLESSLREAAHRTFEQVVSLTSSGSEPGRLGGSDRAMASVAFSGPADGVLQLSVAESFLPRLTARIVTGERALDREFQLDALGELANIICGVMLPSLAPDRSFEQSPPRIGGMAGVLAPDAPAASVSLDFAPGVAEVALYLFDRAA